MTESVGFIGLGAMGWPMAARLAAQGTPMTVFDADPANLAKAAEIDGIVASRNARGVAEAADILFSCLPNDTVVRTVYLGQEGLAEVLRPGSVTVDCSTVSPEVTRDVAARLAEKSVDHMDASMLGSVPQAEAGEIGFVVGGAPAAYDRLAPLLDILGRFRRHTGPAGSANQIKLIHQTLVAANAVAVAEALALCRASGTDLDCFYDIVCGGGGFAYSRYFEKRIPRLRAGDTSPLFMLDPRVRPGIGDAFGPSEIGPLLGTRRQDMPKHIQRRATRQRVDFAGSVRTGRICARAASRKPCGAQAPRRLPLLPPLGPCAQIRSRQTRHLRPDGP